jgi:acetyl esterase/lipase
MSRRPLLLASLAAAVLAPLARAAEPLEIPVWTGVAPGSEGYSAPETVQQRGRNGVDNRALRQISRPTLTVYLPEKAAANGVALVIAPGGGYEHVTIDNEGHAIARRFVAQGIACAVLKYRLPHPPFTKQTTLSDALEAIQVVRDHAAAWGIDPAKVGMMGFSAGGNLAALAGTKPARESRPSFLALIYPVVEKDFGGVPADVPPTFIIQAIDTSIGPDNSVRFYQWVADRKVPVELHLFTKGGHGFGLGQPGSSAAEWPQLFVKWLAETGFVAGQPAGAPVGGPAQF